MSSRTLMPGLLYDTGALVAAERRHPLIWWLHDRANAAGRACAVAGTSDVVTIDPDDLAHLAASPGATLALHPL